MHPLCNPSTGKIMYQFSCFCSIFCSVNQFYFSRSRNDHFGIFVNISIGMSCKCNRLFPVCYTRLNAFYYDRSSKYGSVQHGTNGSVWAFIHFFQVIFLHTCSIWCNGCTFDSNFVFLCGIGCVYGYLVIGLISVFQTQIIIFCIQIDIWLQKFFFDYFPKDSGHFISVHFHKRGSHLDFFHFVVLPSTQPLFFL